MKKTTYVSAATWDRRPGLTRWREALFAFMHHNAQRPGAYFKIPGAQIMEIGVEFEI